MLIHTYSNTIYAYTRIHILIYIRTYTPLVEEGHGTKLLPTGEIRFDCRSPYSTCRALVETHILDSINRSRNQHLLNTRINDMKRFLINKYNIRSIEAGIGVTDTMLDECLVRMCDVSRGSVTGGGSGHVRGDRLTSLAGFKVKIGRYLGVSDEGAVTLPWTIFRAAGEEEGE